MRKLALAGAVALAMTGLIDLRPGFGPASAVAQDIVISESQIAQLRSALRLTPDQVPHWRPVEATLRALVHRRQVRLASADGGFMTRTQSRLAGYTLDALAMQRVKSAARPLIGVLRDDQKHAGMAVLQSMGVSF